MKTEAPIQFKGTSLKIIQVQLREADLSRLAAALAAMTGGATDFFDGELAVIDLSGLPPEAAEKPIELPPILALLRTYGLQPVAVLGAASDHAKDAAAAGLAMLAADALGRPSRTQVSPPVVPAVAAAPAEIAADRVQAELPLVETPRPAAARRPPAPPPATLAPAPAAPAETTSLIIDKPLRSGQRVYARGGDLVVLAMVSAGAEVIADGNIHVYAPLRGRALAGAAGNASARIFTTSLEAELVSIAGVYRTFESGLPAGLAGKPARIGLGADAASLSIEPLSIR